MRVTPVPFTASGLLVNPSYTDPASAAGNLGRETTDGAVTSSQEAITGFTDDFDSAGTSLLTAPGAHATTVTGEVLVVGLTGSGFTKVVLHNGLDNTGDVVMVLTGDGNVTGSYEIYCRKGLYVEVTGGPGKGSVWVS